jgi:hypothetical protein
VGEVKCLAHAYMFVRTKLATLCRVARVDNHKSVEMGGQP